MEKKSKKQGGGKAPTQGGSFEQELGPLVKAIDDAVAAIPNARQRREVRKTVGEAVHGAMRYLAQRGSSRGLAAQGVNASTINTGVDAIKQVQNLGFVEFTSGLINGTFDAIIGATVKQMEAYAALVADLAKTLTEFKADNVTEAQISAHLASRYPDGSGGTSVRPSYEFTPTAADPVTGTLAKSAHDKLIEVKDSLIQETKTNKTPLEFSGVNAIDNLATKFTQGQVTLARTAVGEMLAISMIEHLRAMAREGMARIVITDGELTSKLTFNVTATAEQEARRSQYNQYKSNGTTAGWNWWNWGYSYNNYNQLNVSTVNETSHDKVTMNAEIIGMVKLKFKTESYPPIVTDNAIE
jgi:hypothetical protein